VLKPFAMLPLLAMLGGCAGYAADYWKSKDKLVGPQLARYGLTGSQAQCVTGKLKENLSVWQLRQLGDLAGRLQSGGQNPTALGPRDFLYVAGLVKDPKVGVEAGRALDACGATGGPPVRTAADTAPPPAAVQTPAAPPAAAPLWVNLGTAASGQAISVDAASLENAPGWRQGWFRLANPGEAGPGALSYHLKIDCAAHAITATGGRKYGPGGEIVEQKDYPTPQGPLPVEAGTVMEVAYRGLCS